MPIKLEVVKIGCRVVTTYMVDKRLNINVHNNIVRIINVSYAPCPNPTIVRISSRFKISDLVYSRLPASLVVFLPNVRLP
jgi:hypothetical protein